MNSSHSRSTPSSSQKKLSESDSNLNISCKTSTQETKNIHPIELKHSRKSANRP